MSGIVAVANGGTGASNAGTARSNLGLGSMATQNSGSVSISGGTISGITFSGITYASLTAYGGGGNTTTATAFGTNALAANQSGGIYNTAFGRNSLQNNTTGDQNTACGDAALGSVTTASNNTAVGDSAGLALTTGSSNTLLGASAFGSATTTGYTTAIGVYSLYYSTSGQYNTAVGYQSGGNIIYGEKNVCVGYAAQASGAYGNNEIVLGTSVLGAGSSYITMGSSSGKVYNAYTVNATWTQTSDERLKRNIQNDSLGLSFINRLRPVKYQWKPSNEIDQSLPYYKETNERDTETVMHGLVAQEVKAALDAEGVSTFAGWDVGVDQIQAISREMFVTPLINAVKELSAKCDALQAEVDALKAK